MRRAWGVEITWALLFAGIGAGIGIVAGNSAWGVAGGLAVVLGWRLWMFGLLLRRLERGTKVFFAPGGLVAEVEDYCRRWRRDDTARRSDLARLRRELVTFARAMPDAALVLDRHGAIQWANMAARRWFGLRPEDIGRPLVQLVRDPLLIERLAGADESGSMEMPSPAAPNTELMVQLTPYGDAGRTLILARDVTHLKRLERMRHDFVANVSHELKSPLTVVSGYVELLADDPEVPATWIEPVAALNREVRRMSAIVNDLLALARLESAVRPPERVPVAMPALLRRVRAQAYSAAVGQRHIELDIQTELQVLGDEAELESAVRNLLSNAMKYTSGAGHIRIIWRVVGQNTQLRVEDNGIGIPERDIPRLTERFYRVDKGRSARSGGTGLGLAIVKHVAERHGARLCIESEPGQGSCFTLVFPRARILWG